MNEYIEENFNIRPLFSVSNFQPVREKRGKKNWKNSLNINETPGVRSPIKTVLISTVILF